VNDADGYPLKGVTVTLNDIEYSKSVETDKEGYYEFRNLSAGDYMLTCEKDGYQTYTKSTSRGDGETLELGTITLEKVVASPTPSSTPKQTQIDFSGKWEGEFYSKYAIMKLTQVKRKVTGKMIFYDDEKGKIKGRIGRDGILHCIISGVSATMVKTDDDTITIYYWNGNTGEYEEPEFTRY
jgi:hypothetical protein